MKQLMSKTRWMGLVGLLALGLLMTGCASSRVYQMYDNPPRPVDQIARLIVPNAIDAYSIDGKVVYDFLLKVGKSEIHLLPGPHSVVARYDAIWNEGPEGQQAVKSGLVGMNFDARAGHVYRIAFPEPQDVDSAIKFADHVKLWIEDTQVVATTNAVTPAVALPVQKPAAAPSLASPPASAALSLVAAPVPSKPGAESLPLQNLKFWWQKADEQDHRQFRKWMPPAP